MLLSQVCAAIGCYLSASESQTAGLLMIWSTPRTRTNFAAEQRWRRRIGNLQNNNRGLRRRTLDHERICRWRHLAARNRRIFCQMFAPSGMKKVQNRYQSQVNWLTHDEADAANCQPQCCHDGCGINEMPIASGGALSGEALKIVDGAPSNCC